MNPTTQRSGRVMLNPVIPILANQLPAAGSASKTKAGALSGDFLVGVGNKGVAGVSGMLAGIGQSRNLGFLTDSNPAYFSALLNNAVSARQSGDKVSEPQAIPAEVTQGAKATGRNNPETLEALRQALDRLEGIPESDASFIARLKNLLDKSMKLAASGEASPSEEIPAAKDADALQPQNLKSFKDKDLQDLLNCPVLGPIVQNLLQSLQIPETDSPAVESGIGTQAGPSGNAKAMQGLLMRLSVTLQKLRDALGKIAPEGTQLPIAASKSFPNPIADSEIPKPLIGTLQQAPILADASATAPATPDLIYFGNASSAKAVYVVALEPLARQIKPALDQSAFDGNVIARLEKALNKIDQVIQEIERADRPSNGLDYESPLSSASYTNSAPIALINDDSLNILHAATVSSHSSMLDRINVVQQTQSAMIDMVQRMRGEVTLDSPNMQATIHLDPPALGRIHINLAIDDTQNVMAHVSADNAATQDFLQQHQQNLKHELAQQGFASDKINIRFEDADSEAFTQSLETTMASA